MSAVQFVQSLLDTGRVKVPPGSEPLDDVDEAVAELDRAARTDVAFEPPAIALPAGAWALTTVYRAAQALVFREIDADAVRQMLAVPCPLPPSPAVHYSADLCLRYLPDLLALARGIAPDDPLVTGLVALARAWPLSSVGVAGAGEADPSPFLDHPSLRRLYVDRIIERSDTSRLAHPATRAAVRETVGAFPSLAPKLSQHLQSPA
jgi:hypothetical protein